MPFFKKKPIIIEAYKFTGNNYGVLLSFANRHISRRPGASTVDIHTLEGVMEAAIGDWIICGINGEFYPCKPDIFLKTYDEVPSLAPPI